MLSAEQFSDFEELSHGPCTTVYTCINQVNGEKVAFKAMENDIAIYGKIETEYEIYQSIHKQEDKVIDELLYCMPIVLTNLIASYHSIQGIPNIYGYMKTDIQQGIIMEFLGSNLKNLFTKYNNIFSLNTVFAISIEAIMLIQRLHQSSIIHRDIKPSNFCIGSEQNNAHYLYIIDYNLSRFYKDSQGKHIACQNNQHPVGTYLFNTKNVSSGFTASRRDDLESLGYVLCYFAKNGFLPWYSLKRQQSIFKKLQTPIKEITVDLPICFTVYLQYCQNLQFDETPNYDYLKSLFIETAREMNIVPRFQWLDV